MIRDARLDRLYTVVLPVAFALSLLAGCGSYDKAPAKLVLVSGKVTMGGTRFQERE